jgi:hypothetical protein
MTERPMTERPMTERPPANQASANRAPETYAILFVRASIGCGGMCEWLKQAVLKTALP